MIDVNGRTAKLPSKSVGNQYADASVRGPQRAAVGLSRSEAGVESASAERFPMNVWLCDRPDCPGKTIGSSLFRCVEPQSTTKYGPPGKPAPRGVGYRAANAVAATPTAVSSASTTTANRRRVTPVDTPLARAWAPAAEASRAARLLASRSQSSLRRACG